MILSPSQQPNLRSKVGNQQDARNLKVGTGTGTANLESPEPQDLPSPFLPRSEKPKSRRLSASKKVRHLRSENLKGKSSILQIQARSKPDPRLEEKLDPYSQTYFRQPQAVTPEEEHHQGQALCQDQHFPESQTEEDSCQIGQD